MINELDLLRRIVTPNRGEMFLPVDITRLTKIIREEIPQALEKQAPPNFPELYFDFEQIYGQFHDFLLFDKLIGKNIVALGGSFSSGKSTFLNSLLGKRILPAHIDPSTSVPTYVIHDNEEKAWGINAFDVKLDLSFSDIKSIAHGFGMDETEEDSEASVNSEGITLGHLLKSVFVSATEMPYHNIAFLDTPGYSKPDSDSYSAKTDERIARAQLNSSNYILWFVPADSGIITNDDVAFLHSLDKSIPKLIIITKADKAPSNEELENTRAKIKSVLDVKGIRYEDVLLFSRKSGQEYDKTKISECLTSLDGMKQEVDFARSFKKLFVDCKDYYNGEIHEANVRLSRLNKALTLGGDNTAVNEYLSGLAMDIRSELSTLKEAQNNLHKLQQEFFTEIKFVGDKVGIMMPEPSEIDLIRDDFTDAAAIVKGMLKKRNLPTESPFLGLLQQSLASIAPKAQEMPGGAEHKRVLYELLKEKLG